MILDYKAKSVTYISHCGQIVSKADTRRHLCDPYSTPPLSHFL